jgi:hypothetical protein
MIPGGIIRNVFWVQIATSFLIWIGAGAVLMRRSESLRTHAFAVPRTPRALRAALLFVISPLGIFAPLLLISSVGGLRPDRLLLWAWLLVSLGGLVCVGAATYGLAYAVAIAMESAIESRVTPGEAATSTMKDSSDPQL